MASPLRLPSAFLRHVGVYSSKTDTKEESLCHPFNVVIQRPDCVLPLTTFQYSPDLHNIRIGIPVMKALGPRMRLTRLRNRASVERSVSKTAAVVLERLLDNGLAGIMVSAGVCGFRAISVDVVD